MLCMVVMTQHGQDSLLATSVRLIADDEAYIAQNVIDVISAVRLQRYFNYLQAIKRVPDAVIDSGIPYILSDIVQHIPAGAEEVKFRYCSV